MSNVSRAHDRVAYDQLNRLVVKTVPASGSGAVGYSVHYGYDIHGRQISYVDKKEVR